LVEPTGSVATDRQPISRSPLLRVEILGKRSGREVLVCAPRAGVSRRDTTAAGEDLRHTVASTGEDAPNPTVVVLVIALQERRVPAPDDEQAGIDGRPRGEGG